MIGLLDEILDAGLESYNTRAYVQEKEKEYEFEVELPGFRKEEVSVFVEDSVLSIKAEQKNKKINKKRNREILMPEDFNPDKISAKLEDGLLKISIAKQKPQTRKIKIEV